MEKNKFLTVNLSNQGNLTETEKTKLLQNNIFILIAENNLEDTHLPEKPVSVFVKKNGEIEIINLDNSVTDENIKIYSDKKITSSEDKNDGKGDLK